MPASGRGQGSAYEKFSHPASRYAVIGAAALVTRARTARAARRASRSAACCRTRGGRRAVERALTARPPTDGDDRGRGREQVAADLGSDVTGDIFASAEYRTRDGAGVRQARAAAAAARASQVCAGQHGRRDLDACRQTRRSRHRSTSCSRRWRAQQYVAERGLAVSIYLALRLQRPLFLEGEAGVGKTEVAKVLAAALDTELIRLQCYEGLDISHAVYEWNYPRQILEIRLLESAHALDRAGGRARAVHRGVSDQAAAAARDRADARAAAGAADRRDRSRRRGVRGLPARAAVRLPGHDSRARHHPRRDAAGRRDHVEPDARSARRAEAPLCLQLDRLSRLRQGAPHRRGARCRACRRGWPSR